MTTTCGRRIDLLETGSSRARSAVKHWSYMWIVLLLVNRSIIWRSWSTIKKMFSTTLTHTRFEGKLWEKFWEKVMTDAITIIDHINPSKPDNKESVYRHPGIV